MLGRGCQGFSGNFLQLLRREPLALAKVGLVADRKKIPTIFLVHEHGGSPHSASLDVAVCPSDATRVGRLITRSYPHGLISSELEINFGDAIRTCELRGAVWCLCGSDGRGRCGGGESRMLIHGLDVDAPSKGWWKMYAGPEDCAEAHAIAVDTEGGLYVGGMIDLDLGVLKFDSETGKRLWIRRQPGDETDRPFDTASSVAVDRSGNVFVTGSVNGDYANFELEGDIVLVKYSQGEISATETIDDDESVSRLPSIERDVRLIETEE